MLQQYASAWRRTPPALQLSAISGATTIGGTYYFWLQLQNQSGRTLHNPSATITITPGQGIRVTIPSDALRNGEYALYYVVSASETNDSTTAAKLFEVKVFNDGARVALPIVVDLARDEHLAIAANVNTTSDLPAGADLIRGMVRGISTTGDFYRYDPDATEGSVPATPSGYWLPANPWTTWYGYDSMLPGGSDQRYESIDPATVEVRPYAADGSQSDRAHYWLYWDKNPDGNISTVGQIVSSSVYLDGSPVSHLFAGLVKYVFHGYVSPEGELDTEDMLLAGAILPQQYNAQGTNLFRLEKDLPAGHAIWISAYLELERSQVGQMLGDGSQVLVRFNFRAQAGERVPGAEGTFGDIVLATGNFLRILPKTGLTALVSPGSAIVKGFEFSLERDYTLYGIQPNTVGQKVAVDGNGYFQVLQPNESLHPSSALRAILGTAPGESAASAWTNSATFTGGAEVAIAHPTTIRAGYPTIGGATAPINPGYVRIYARRGSETKYWQFAIAGDDATEIFEISDWDTGTVATPPAAPFSFWTPGIVSATQTSGSLDSGSYQFAYSYYYSGSEVSSISHEVSQGCMPEFLVNFAEIARAAATIITPEDIQASVIPLILALGG